MPGGIDLVVKCYALRDGPGVVWMSLHTVAACCLAKLAGATKGID